MQPIAKPWTEAEKTQVRAWYDEGLSAGQIIEMLGSSRTRNSIISLWHRSGYPPRVQPHISGRIKARKPRPSRSKNLSRHPVKVRRPHPHNGAAGPNEDELPSPEYLAFLATEPQSKKLTTLELTPSTCRYGTDYNEQHLFCGVQVEEGSTWCEFHAIIVYKDRSIPKQTGET